jgi:formate-dependent nitrite reductase cytochrome c552 subunit
MLLGLGGAGVDGSAAAHSSMVEDTCVTCHMGENYDHSMEPNKAACTGCHADLEDLDYNDVQTEIKALGEKILALLEAKGMWHDGEAVEEVSYPEAEAQALWNYIYVIVEDGSFGVHNPKFAKAMLEAALDALD